MISSYLLPKILRHYPLDRGHLRIYNLISDAAKAGFDELAQPVQMRSGIKLHVRSDDHLSRWFRCFGTYEPRTSKMLKKHVTADQVFVDIGANLGLHSIQVARDVGCDVVSFEPHTPTADCLEQSIELNQLSDRIKVFRHALSNENGTATLVQPLDHAGKSALKGPNPNFRNGGEFEVPVSKLDDMEEFHAHLDQLGKKVGLVKMDIEGAEELALRGMVDLLKEHRPAIMIELYDGNLFGFVSSKKAVIAFIESLGYKLVTELEWNGLFLPVDNG